MVTETEKSDCDVKNGMHAEEPFPETEYSPDEIRDLFRQGKYPYEGKIKTSVYEAHKKELQVELLKAQNWVKQTGQRVVCLFEGRDAAGEGGTIKRFTEHLNPRATRVVALEKPTDIERSQRYFQRYISHLPAAGEIVLFDSRQGDPLKQWKLSPIDEESRTKWLEYTQAKEAMFFYTDTADAPWTVIKSDDKKRARLNCIQYFLSSLDYPDKDLQVVKGSDPLIVGHPSQVIEKERHLWD